MSSVSGSVGGPGAEKQSFHSVNRHCLASIINLSERQTVLAAEDICDSNGTKLWAKGNRISGEVQEKLLRRKLARPLELTLTIDNGVLAESVVGECLKLIEEKPELRLLAGSKDARSLLTDFRVLTMPSVVKLLLTSARENGLGTYSHSLHAMVVCAGIAARLGFSDHDAQLLLCASLVHDLGEMYINPEFLKPGGTLSLHQWMNVAVHPRVGRAMIEELTNLHPSIAIGVGEHHERLDGSGYPGQLGQAAISKFGRILAVADSVSALLDKGGNEVAARINLALRIVPEEFDPAVVKVVTKALSGQKIEAGEPINQQNLALVGGIFQRLQNAMAAAEQLVGQSANPQASNNAVSNGAYVLPVLTNLAKSLRATGVVEALRIDSLNDDQVLATEMFLVAREVDWRLRNLARNVNLRAELGGKPEDLQQVAELIAALDAPAAAA